MWLAARAFGLVGLSLIVAGGAAAQDLLPPKRSVMVQDVDLPGGDLRSLFNTTLEACERACQIDNACTAFTFNSRNGSCFPKANPGEGAPYRGAISARIVAASAATLARATERRADLAFLRPWQFEQVLEQARTLGRNHLTQGLTQADLRAAAVAARQAGDLAYAAQLFGAAASAGDDAADWQAMGLALLGQSGGDSWQDRQYAEQAVQSLINAYLRSGSDAQRHTILVDLAQALERVGQGRNALSAARQAQKIQRRDDTAVLLARLESLFGFRIEEHQVQSELASPRLCASFTEDLIETGLDYSPFVQLPEPGMTVEPGGWRELCVTGLRHGERYALTFRAGLPAADGQVLTQPVTITAYVRDRSPSARFAGRSYVLPAAAGAAIPVETVNTTSVDLELYTITDRNLIRSMRADWFARQMEIWQSNDFTESVAERIWQGQATVERVVNQSVTTRLPLDSALQGRGAGIYALRAQASGADPYANAPAWQWFVVSDLGLTTLSGADGVTVVARSLADASAKPGARVELLARSNRVLGVAQTDDQGVARFDASAALGTGASQPALVVVTSGDDDIAFLSLTDPEFDLSDRGVQGRPAPPPIDLFLTTDRGAYRAGEVIYATALARDGQARAIKGLPLIAVLKRPDGVEYSRSVINDWAGGYVFSLPVAATAPRGAWRIEVLADPAAPPLATAQVLVEDFLPERIDFDLSLTEGALSLSDLPQIDLTARYLFGAPGAGLSGEGDVILRAAREVAGWPGYSFGRAGQGFDVRLESILPFTTDDAGKARLVAALPQISDPGLPLEALIRLRLAEGSGRPVERTLVRAVEPAGPMIGLKPAFDGTVAENTQAEVAVIAVDASGTVAVPVKWRLDRIETQYQWYSLSGEWRWEPVTSRKRVADGKAETGAQPLTLAMPVEWGEYELTVERDGGAFAASSIRFAAGWYAPADAARSPDLLEMSLDKPGYRAGDTAMLRVVPRAAGTALVSVLSNRVVSMQAVQVVEGENLIPLTVTDDWGAGAYVTASVLRPMDVAQGRNPARAMGLAHAAVDPGNRKLGVAIDAASESDPRAPLTATLRVSGIAPGETAYATLAAVDQGILNLTGFTSPDPSAHYFGQRRLGVGLRDLYGRLIDGMSGAMGEVRSGGDGAVNRLLAPPPTEELVAYFTGPVEIGPDGTAQVAFDMPSFNGSVRLMAVVWSDSAVGQAEAEVLVRDPVVVTASLPRFMSPGDTARLLLEITHATGPVGRMGLDVVADGVALGAVASGVDLAQGGKAVLEVPVTAGPEGVAQIVVSLTTPDGRVLRKPLALPVQANDPETARHALVELAAGQELTLGTDALAGLHPASARATVSAGSTARFNTAGLLAALDRYPYGCSEQITSQALPLLALGPMAREMGLQGAEDIDSRLNQTIARLLLNQTTEGGFGLWNAISGSDLWLDAYVTDFLSRARAQGTAVPDRAFRAALDNLRNRVNYAGDFESGGGDLAYALMVLAREGAAAVGDLRYYADVKANAFDTPVALAQLGAALAMYGDQPRADALFAQASQMALAAQEDGQVWRADFGSALRDRAAVLTLASEMGSTAINREALTSALAGQAAQVLSTQEAAWMLLASATQGAVDQISLNGALVNGPLARMIRPGDAPLSVRNDGSGAVPLIVSAYGVAEGTLEAGGNGYAITRRYFTPEGAAIDPAQVRSGARLVAVLEVTPLDSGEARLIVNDPLPAGFEIDNPNLVDSGRLAGLDWLEAVTEVQMAEFRQDRFVAAIDRRDGESFRLAYVLRAVTPGSFHHPAASVEDMYRPAFRAHTASGRVTVSP
jgi:alpha-2-macroglobulin